MAATILTNDKNIRSLNKELIHQRDRLDVLADAVVKLSNTIALLQSEIAVTKRLAVYSKGNGPTT